MNFKYNLGGAVDAASQVSGNLYTDCPAHQEPSRKSIASRLFTALWLVLSALLPGGCSTVHDIVKIEEVKPWQRGALARDDMQLVSDPMQQSVDDHIYFSKEGSSGGSSLEGGGCGCN